MTDDDHQLQDPVVIAALRRLGQSGPTRDLCPGCGRRYLEDDQELCGECHAQQRRRGKAEWYARQGDYRQLRLDHGARDAAVRWIAHQLRRGPVEYDRIRADADRAGISQRTLRRAREQLQHRGRLVVERHGLAPGRVRWRLTTLAERRTDGQVAVGSHPERADSAHPSGRLAGHDDGDDDQEPDR